MKIKIEPFLMRKGIKVAKAAIEFDSNDVLEGFHLVGFTICDDPHKGLYVLFPSSLSKNQQGESKQYFFLRPATPDLIDKLEGKILDVYQDMMDVHEKDDEKKDHNRARS